MKWFVCHVDYPLVEASSMEEAVKAEESFPRFFSFADPLDFQRRIDVERIDLDVLSEEEYMDMYRAEPPEPHFGMFDDQRS